MSASASSQPQPATRSQRGLDWLNFFLADVQVGVGTYVATFLTTQGWQEGQIGWPLTVGGLAGMLCQAPGGALVDASRSKRALLAAALAVIAAGAVVFALYPSYWPVMLAQVSHGIVGGAMGPAVAAISLGLVGRRALADRNGRNHCFDSAGNIVTALLMGWVGYHYSLHAIFYISAALSIPALVALWCIRPEEIDYARARGADAPEKEKTDGDKGAQSKPEKPWVVFRDRRLLLFAACAVMFHFANAAMLPLIGEMLAKGRSVKQVPALLSACLIVTQVVVVLLAKPTGRGAERWGRKSLLLITFAVLPVRGGSLHADQSPDATHRRAGARRHRRGALRGRLGARHRGSDRCRIDQEEYRKMEPSGEPGLWFLPWNPKLLPDGPHRLTVWVVDRKGGSACDTINMVIDHAGNHQPPPPRPVEMDNRIGAYPEKGITGTFLGPNLLGHPW